MDILPQEAGSSSPSALSEHCSLYRFKLGDVKRMADLLQQKREAHVVRQWPSIWLQTFTEFYSQSRKEELDLKLLSPKQRQAVDTIKDLVVQTCGIVERIFACNARFAFSGSDEQWLQAVSPSAVPLATAVREINEQLDCFMSSLQEEAPTRSKKEEA